MSSGEVENENESELASRRLCAACVGEAYLRSEIERDGTEAKCDYCEETGPTLSLGELAGYIDAAFERHYYITPTDPSPLEYTMMKEGDYGWEREGEPAQYAIASAALIDEAPAEDIREILAERYYDMELAQMGEESPFDEDTYYAGKDPDDIELRENWRYFEHSLKTEARFFSAAAEATLETVFANLHDHKNEDGTGVVVEAGPGAPISAIYRARVFHSVTALEEALKNPDKGLGPPPSHLAIVGRMNARGVAVFYGATGADIALGETRPPVGSRVAVARFELLRPIKLLDVSALRSVYVDGSIFDSGYLGRLELAKFLERLASRFATPVMPGDEPLDYLPTQVIADYLATRIDPPLDGILYPSVQAGGEAVNVVLFHKSSRVAAVERPKGTQVDVHSGHHTDEGWDEDWWIWEETPRPPEEPKKPEPKIPLLTPVLFDPFSYYDGFRDPTLKIDLTSVKVHYVSAANYTTHVHEVRRHRTERKRDDNPDF